MGAIINAVGSDLSLLTIVAAAQQHSIHLKVELIAIIKGFAIDNLLKKNEP